MRLAAAVLGLLLAPADLRAGDWSASTGTVALELGLADEEFFAERPAAFIEAIELIGVEKTTRATLEARLSVAVGDLVDDERIEESRLRLLGTGYFRAVEFSLRRGSRRGRVVLVIEVEERNTIKVDGLFLGFSSVTPFYGGLGVVESNFLGRGVVAGAGFVAGQDRYAVDAHLFVPELPGTPLMLAASAVVAKGRELLDESDPAGHALGYSRVGGTVGLGLNVGVAQRVFVQYRLESVESDRLPNLDPAVLRAAPSIQFDESILSTLSLGYERDTRDDPFVPRHGSRLHVMVETGTQLFGSSYEFTKYTVEAQLALPIFDTHSLRLRFFGGLIQGEAPFFNQFFLSDHAYFALGRDSLPRALGVNFSETNDYDDLLASLNAVYAIPVQSGNDFLLRTFVYAGLDLSLTASLAERQEDASGRGIGDRFPASFDVGLLFDTEVGGFTFSVSYIADLML